MKSRVRQKNSSRDLESDLRPLMLQALAGDKVAYADFLNKVSETLRAYFRKSNSKLSAEQVEDLVQDVLLAIHQKRDTYRPDLPISPWLYTIARYKLIDSYRLECRRPPVDMFAKDLESLEAPNCDLHINCIDLHSILSPLSEKQRRVLHLAKVEERPLSEIGTTMQMSLSSVKVTIHRAMAILKRGHTQALPVAESLNED